MKALSLTQESDGARVNMTFRSVTTFAILESPDHKHAVLTVYDGPLYTPWSFPLTPANKVAFDAWRKDRGL